MLAHLDAGDTSLRCATTPYGRRTRPYSKANSFGGGTNEQTSAEKTHAQLQRLTSEEALPKRLRPLATSPTILPPFDNQRASEGGNWTDRPPGPFLTRERRPPSRPKQRAQTRNGLNTGHRNPSANMTANLLCRPLVAECTDWGVDTDR